MKFVLFAAVYNPLPVLILFYEMSREGKRQNSKGLGGDKLNYTLISVEM